MTVSLSNQTREASGHAAPDGPHLASKAHGPSREGTDGRGRAAMTKDRAAASHRNATPPATYPDEPAAACTASEPGGDGPYKCGCGHAAEAHDQIAARYCAATRSAHLDRGCICAKPAPAGTR